MSISGVVFLAFALHDHCGMLFVCGFDQRVLRNMLILVEGSVTYLIDCMITYSAMISCVMDLASVVVGASRFIERSS